MQWQLSDFGEEQSYSLLNIQVRQCLYLLRILPTEMLTRAAASSQE